VLVLEVYSIATWHYLEEVMCTKYQIVEWSKQEPITHSRVMGSWSKKAYQSIYCDE